MKLRCIEEIEGLTIGKTYKMIGCAGEYVQVKDDNKEAVTVYEGCFEAINRRTWNSLKKSLKKKIAG